QIGWLFAVTTGVAMVLRPQVGGWTDRYGARAVMLPGAAALLLTMLALTLVRTPGGLIALMAGLGIANALISTTGSIVVAADSPATRRGEALSLYYVASSVGVALGPVVGFTLADVGGMPMNFAVVIALALVVVGLAVALRPVAGVAAAPGRFGHAPVLRPAVVAVALGNALLAAPPSVATLVVSAALLGCGNSMLYPTLVALVVDRTPEPQRGRAIGTVSGAWDVGVAIGSPVV